MLLSCRFLMLSASIIKVCQVYQSPSGGLFVGTDFVEFVQSGQVVLRQMECLFWFAYCNYKRITKAPKIEITPITAYSEVMIFLNDFHFVFVETLPVFLLSFTHSVKNPFKNHGQEIEKQTDRLVLQVGFNDERHDQRCKVFHTTGLSEPGF